MSREPSRPTTITEILRTLDDAVMADMDEEIGKIVAAACALNNILWERGQLGRPPHRAEEDWDLD